MWYGEQKHGGDMELRWFEYEAVERRHTAVVGQKPYDVTVIKKKLQYRDRWFHEWEDVSIVELEGDKHE